MQRVNAPAGQMQLKSLIEAYVVSELRSFTKRQVLYQMLPAPNLANFLHFKGKNGQWERCHNFEGMGGLFASLLATGTAQWRRLTWGLCRVRESARQASNHPTVCEVIKSDNWWLSLQSTLVAKWSSSDCVDKDVTTYVKHWSAAPKDSNFVEARTRSSFGVELAEPSRVVFDALVAP